MCLQGIFPPIAATTPVAFHHRSIGSGRSNGGGGGSINRIPCINFDTYREVCIGAPLSRKQPLSPVSSAAPWQASRPAHSPTRPSAHPPPACPHARPSAHPPVTYVRSPAQSRTSLPDKPSRERRCVCYASADLPTVEVTQPYRHTYTQSNNNTAVGLHQPQIYRQLRRQRQF